MYPPNQLDGKVGSSVTRKAAAAGTTKKLGEELLSGDRNAVAVC